MLLDKAVNQIHKTMKRTLTPEQQARSAERKAKFRALWKQVADMPELERMQLSNKMGIVTCDGHGLSCKNQCLLAFQFPTVTVCGGFKQWLKHGRCVAKGQHGLMIWVPTGGKKNQTPLDGTAGGVSAVADGAPESDSDHRFIIGTVFDISQTVELPSRHDVLTSTTETLELQAA